MADSHNHHQDHNQRPHYEPLPEPKLPFLLKLFDAPATFIREKFVEPLQERNRQVYYHREFKRVPTIDQCSVNDDVCIFEANEQFLRDKAVDKRIALLLADKYYDCVFKEGPYEQQKNCRKLEEMYDEALVNYFIKYGDMGAHTHVIDAYMKQKHRLIWERRNPNKDIVGLEKRNELRKLSDEAHKKYFEKTY